MVPTSGARVRLAHEERSDELGTYVRTEYPGADAAWMRARIRDEVSRAHGLRARLDRRRARNRGRTPAVAARTLAAPSGAGTDTGPRFPLPVGSCPHDDLTLLGRNRGTSFARCRGCGSILIQAVESTYLLRPSPRTADLVAAGL